MQKQLRKLTRPQILLLAVCSLYSCAVQRPNVDLCIVNAPAANRKCYNMHDDYNNDGTLKAGAVAKYRDNKDVSDLSKALVIDSPTGYEDGLAAIKTYIKQLRTHYENCGNGNAVF